MKYVYSLIWNNVLVTAGDMNTDECLVRGDLEEVRASIVRWKDLVVRYAASKRDDMVVRAHKTVVIGSIMRERVLETPDEIAQDLGGLDDADDWDEDSDGWTVGVDYDPRSGMIWCDGYPEFEFKLGF